MVLNIADNIERYRVILDRLKRLGEMHTAIVELHAPIESNAANRRYTVTCHGCDQPDLIYNAATWPCRTAQLILDGPQS